MQTSSIFVCCDVFYVCFSCSNGHICVFVWTILSIYMYPIIWHCLFGRQHLSFKSSENVIIKPSTTCPKPLARFSVIFWGCQYFLKLKSNLCWKENNFLNRVWLTEIRNYSLRSYCLIMCVFLPMIVTKHNKS